MSLFRYFHLNFYTFFIIVFLFKFLYFLPISVCLPLVIYKSSNLPQVFPFCYVYVLVSYLLKSQLENLFFNLEVLKSLLEIICNLFNSTKLIIDVYVIKVFRGRSSYRVFQKSRSSLYNFEPSRYKNETSGMFLSQRGPSSRGVIIFAPPSRGGRGAPTFFFKW